MTAISYDKWMGAVVDYCLSQIEMPKIKCRRGPAKSLPYPPEWTEELRESIRCRDGYKCQRCGKRQAEEVAQLGCKLSVHHKDYDKQNCHPTNLETLCYACHIKGEHYGVTVECVDGTLYKDSGEVGGALMLKDFILIASQKIKRCLRKKAMDAGLAGLRSYIIRVEKVWSFLETEQPKKSAQMGRVKSSFTR